MGRLHYIATMQYRYPVMWQGHFTLKNDNAAVQLHFLSGNMELAKKSLPFPTQEKPTPSLRIAQRMRLEATQIEGVEKRIQVSCYHNVKISLTHYRWLLNIVCY